MASVASNYAKRMTRLAARIFGEVYRPTDQKSMKVVKIFSAQPLDKNPEITNYYPDHWKIHSLMSKLRFHGLYR